MILVFTGNDRTLVQQQIKHILKENNLAKVNQQNSCKQACLSCLSRGFTKEITASLLEVSSQELKIDIKTVSRLAKSKNLLFIVCEGLSLRTKLGKTLKPYIVSNVDLPNNWNSKDINKAIDFYAQNYNLTLSYVVKDYLRQALNNNFALLNSGLSTLALMSHNPSLELVREVIPSEYATAIDLKEMILAKQKQELPEYILKLQGLVPDRVIVASLATQFTLLMQSAIALSQDLSDGQVAKFAGISNVKRLYFIKQDLATVTVEQLVWLNTILRNTKNDLKYNRCDLLARLMLMCCY